MTNTTTNDTDRPLLSDGFHLIAGEANLRAQRTAEAALMASGCSLPQAQERQRSGVIGITLVRSIYGWSVRYASGLQGFGLIRSSHMPECIGPREHDAELANYREAEAYARKWADGYRGYAFVSTWELSRMGILSDVIAQ